MVAIELTLEEADMIAKVLLLARRGDLGHVTYRAPLLSKTRTKIMKAAGLRTAEPRPSYNIKEI